MGKQRSIMLVQLGGALVMVGLWWLSGQEILTGEPQPEVWRFLGRFHPVVLHLPIAFLVLLLGLEGRVLWRSESKAAELVPMVLGLTIGVTLLAVATGTLLAYGEGADEPLVREHMRNGIWLAMGTVMLGVLRTLPSQFTYRVLLVVTGGLLVVTSHQGGSITHGSDYLTKYAPETVRRLLGLEVKTKVAVQRPEDLVIFTDLVQPLLEQNCHACHNPDKLKGDLNLTTIEGHLAGGEMAPAVVPYDLEASELLFRVTLPMDDEEFMPPDEKPPLSRDEIELLRWWIEQGASPVQKVGEANSISDSVDAYVRRVFATMLTPAERDAIVAAERKLYQDLGEIRAVYGVLILPVEKDATEFMLETNAVRKTFDDSVLRALEPYADHIVAADLSGTPLSDRAMTSLAKFSRLRSLNLSHTQITGGTLGQLAVLPNLAVLNLYGAALVPDAVTQIEQLKGLRKLIVFQTDLAEGAWFDALQLALPNCEIRGAMTAETVATGMVIEDLGKDYQFDPSRSRPGLFHHVETENVIGGNTSVRNEARETLLWKGKPDSNGYGYFQRNRDLGQVINVPTEGGEVVVDAIVLRSSRGDNAIMAGVPGSKLYLQFFEVELPPGAVLQINENGTGEGQSATHGFDHQYNRADDFIEGPVYRPMVRVKGGVFPDTPTTDQYVYDRGMGEPFGEQPGHLRFLRFDLIGNDELTLKEGRRYAFMLGFEEPGVDRGLALAIATEVHAKKAAEFVRDEKGVIRWGVRREGSGGIVPTMISGEQPPSDPEQRTQLEDESLFPARHWQTIPPTSNGYPDVDTYRTLQFYIEVK